MKLPAVSSAPLLVTALLAPAWLAGCSPSATYGTGQAPEMALFHEMTGGILGGGKKEPIDYQPRAPLVMPPATETAQLPAPTNAAAAASPDWPVDPNQQVASAAPTGSGDHQDVRSGGSRAEYQRLKPLADAMPDRPRQPFEAGEHRPTRDLVHSKEQREEFNRAVAEAQGYSDGERRYLTDPPTEYRQPASTAPAEFDNIEKHKGGGWFGWLFHRGG